MPNYFQKTGDLLLHTDQVIVVEGKYDKIKLESVIDAPIVYTNGFGIFKDKEKLKLLRKMAAKSGIIVLTDSDPAGFMIRSHIAGAFPQEQVTHVYIPELLGREKRKKADSAAGLLGVEGVSTQVLLKAFAAAGVACSTTAAPRRKITHTDLYAAGLSGGVDSAAKRKALLQKLDLPGGMSKNQMLTALNALLDYETFLKLV